MRLILLIIVGLTPVMSLADELETRLHSYEHAPAALVERQLRALIPEGPRVSMNPNAKQVIVIADEETHDMVASMLRELGRPQVTLHFKVRHNQEVRTFSLFDGLPFSLPVSRTPPTSVVQQAVDRLAPEKQQLPVVGSALQIQAKLLREDPEVARLRVLPAVLFGVAAPYEVVDYPQLAMDILITTDSFLELQESLSKHDFYREFLQTQPEANRTARPV
ncbi:MAG: hypothetical protein PF795_11115, partial [Kiritimatiellae bacterium]|nr:hypothetical protein [Kiritimatiellia bacterium]